MAESEGFEPPEDFSSTVFKTAAFDHSASSPDIVRPSIYSSKHSIDLLAYYKHLRRRVIR